MTLNDEIRLQITKLPDAPEIIDNWEPIADSLSGMFNWVGSKIDWKKTIKHMHQELGEDKKCWPSLVKKFSCKYLRDFIYNSEKIHYINDSSLDFALAISVDKIDTMFDLLIEHVPQHHYFFNLDTKWCFVISSEGYLDFGFSN
ncbi:type IV secretion protein Rhs [Lelliottia wanjuensis]|uniref:type IV secretion protein Rhs n=1 Tax=Lelliottia wanjuensis TaxID=3050585 RepID=UPI00254A9D9C|nr:type IV secretion protein Rhs [Lelliottia sp. V86_10]MDK9587309.1 type IV secretion protein Rhs [Lelliottia sp. V86_10]